MSDRLFTSVHVQKNRADQENKETDLINTIKTQLKAGESKSFLFYMLIDEHLILFYT